MVNFERGTCSGAEACYNEDGDPPSSCRPPLPSIAIRGKYNPFGAVSMTLSKLTEDKLFPPHGNLCGRRRGGIFI